MLAVLSYQPTQVGTAAHHCRVPRVLLLMAGYAGDLRVETPLLPMTPRPRVESA